MAAKRKALASGPARTDVIKKLHLDTKALKAKVKLEAPEGQVKVEGSDTPPRNKRISGILKTGEDTRSPGKSVRFPPPSNLRERLACLGEEGAAGLLAQLDSLRGPSLALWLTELTSHISLLDRRPGQGQGVETLVVELLKLKWEGQEEEVAEAYIAFLANLVSACPCYTGLAVKSLFDRFKPAGDLEGRDQDAIMFARVHAALQALLEVAPVGAREEVLGLVADAFPFFKLPAYRQVCFVSAILEMTSYVADSLHRVLATIVEKLIKMDAHLSRDHVETTYRTATEGGRHDGLVSSLDQLMKLMFEFLHDTTHSELGQFDEEKAAPVVECMMDVYTTHLLPTYNIVHTQYLLFYLANLAPSVTSRFLAVTWRAFSAPGSPSILRQTAMAFLASFLSRSSAVTVPQLLALLTRTTNWAHAYVRTREGHASGLDFMYTDLARHGPFYSACQAIFYIFAFRHQELTASPKRLKLVRGLAWHSLVACGFNPLRVCLPGVVRNFSACARHYQLAYCQAVIERNNRINLPVVGSLSAAGAGSKPLLLDCFFPFDPCLLQRSKVWVEPAYLQYHGLEGITEEEESEEEEEDEGEDEGDGMEGEVREGRRARLDSSRSSLSSGGGRRRQDSVGLTELLLQDLPPSK